MDLKKIAERYRNELLERVIPFWLEKSPDMEYGGYFTCLDRDGSLYDTDKFIWLQGREIWMFAMLYNQLEQRQEWLDMAVHGAEFLKKHGHDGNYDFYFSLDRTGKPLVHPYNIFSNTFSCMAFAQLAKATENCEYADIARKTFRRILERRQNPKGQWEKTISSTRALKGFALPMIICNMALEIEDIMDDKTILDITIKECLEEILDVFYKPELGCMLENVCALDGAVADCFEGREINPGHNLEAMWFMMNLGVRLNDGKLIEKCVEISLDVIERGWDKEYGGIFYFMDSMGKPMQKLEWDQKLWWGHLESAIAMIKGYKLTGNVKCLDWFEKLDSYMWSHFRDDEYPEWYGYLNRRGEVLLPLKGGKWKGCFHVPRGLYQIFTILESFGSDMQEA